jgi:hypothetical protein
MTRGELSLSKVLSAVASNPREVVFGLGMLLLSYGLWLVSVPAALIAPGLILIWMAIPRTK